LAQYTKRAFAFAGQGGETGLDNGWEQEKLAASLIGARISPNCLGFAAVKAYTEIILNINNKKPRALCGILARAGFGGQSHQTPNPLPACVRLPQRFLGVAVLGSFSP
jgi:hypothetical protein